MQALMLAAGMGRRMGKYTEACTKCMVPVAGKTLLERAIESIKAAGIDKLVMVIGYEAENLKALQGTFFKDVYRLLLNKEKGPRLYLFLYAIEKDKFLSLLDFSTPMTEEEEKALTAPAEEPVEEEPVVEYGEPDEVAPIGEEIDIEEFRKIDLRVCKVLKCAEIRKSHSCYKLTLFDGIKERVIVSSIKQYYKPEQLIGKKIIVVANLQPTRFVGVKSEGMLLAGTNNACGCQVVIVEDIVPEGTRIC